jgi:crotonobetainyl-CoA:carnitine CoA-transferase CaiB-like acyl-CoA transferase
MSVEGGYSGLHVLDLGQGVAAPYCAMLLAMHGAEVVKLEPVAGDWSRGLGTQYGDHTAMSAHHNRGKRSLALDLRSPAAREIALALADRADIVIEGFRPGVADRLGLGYAALAARNQRLLYLSVSGFGQDGPYAQLPCTDSVAQAFSGLMSVNLGNDGAPHRVGAIIVDTLTGLYAGQAVGVALYARERSGRGRRIEVSLTQCAAAILGHKLAEHILEGGAPRALNVPTGAYRTGDGWIMIALVKEEHFARLATALGRPDLATDPRFPISQPAPDTPQHSVRSSAPSSRPTRPPAGSSECAPPISSRTGSTASTTGLPTPTSAPPAVRLPSTSPAWGSSALHEPPGFRWRPMPG